MKSSRLLRVLLIAGLATLLISYLGFWIRFINDPVERTGSDFIGFYSVGRIADREGASYVYDPLLQQSVQQEVVGFPLAPGQVLLNQHLPFLIPLLQVISGPDYVASFYTWNACMILLYLMSMILLSRALVDRKLDKTSILFLAAGALLFYPLFFSLLNGQDTAILVLGVTIWMVGLLSGREWMAGLGLGLATVRPHIAILLALPMFFRFRKAFWVFTLSSIVLALVSFLILGWRGALDFIDILLTSAEGTWYGLNESKMFNLIGLLLRLFPSVDVDLIHWIGWIVYGFTLAYLCLLWKRSKNLQDGQITLTVVLALFVAPHLHFHDLTLLLIPIYDRIRLQEYEQLTTTIATAIPVAISLLLLISNSTPMLQFTTPYLFSLALVVYPYILKSRASITALRRS